MIAYSETREFKIYFQGDLILTHSLKPSQILPTEKLEHQHFQSSDQGVNPLRVGRVLRHEKNSNAS